MLKLGITTLDGLWRPRTWYGARKFASVLLLGDLSRTPGDGADAADSILRFIEMRNGTWRDTTPGRFVRFDRSVASLLRDRYRGGAPVGVVDLGVASGITSTELFDAVAALLPVELVATDLCRDAFVVRAPRTGIGVVLDDAGAELQHLVGPLVLPGAGAEPGFYPGNRAARWASRRWLLPIARRVLASGRPETLDDFETRVMDGWEVTRIPLLSGRCLDYERRVAGFRFVRADVLDPLPWRADLIRAMNVLSPLHLADAALRTAVGHCVDALNPGGLLVLGRSPDRDERSLRASIFVHDGDRLAVVERTNGGYEREALVLEAGARLALADAVGRSAAAGD